MTVHVAAHPMGAGFGLEVLLVAVVDQGVQALNRFNPDIAAASAVAAVRAAVFNELFPTKRHSAPAARLPTE